MKDIIKEITQNDDKVAYAKTKEITQASKLSKEYYKYLNDFASLLDDEKSYVRSRAFILCCSQAKWDNGKFEKIIPKMVKLLNDPKPTVVRQCLNAIEEVIEYCPKLNKDILKSIKKIDLSIYNDSMSKLIKKDIDNLCNLINKK